MTEVVLPPNLINKLGHNLSEIRVRALLTLLAKIDNGLIFEDDLGQSKDILTKLFEWFLFDESPYEEMVLVLIKRILLTSSGTTLINHYGPNTIIRELKQVKDCIESRYHPIIDEIIDIVNAFKEKIDNLSPSTASTLPTIDKSLGSNHNIDENENNGSVPPLISDIPLSYRSGQSGKSSKHNIENLTSNIQFEDETDEDGNHKLYNLRDILPNLKFQWQPLIESDRHVMRSMEESLVKTYEQSELLHSCDFFMDVLLHDFPAEIFLQRPVIVQTLQNLLYASFSTKVNDSVLRSFQKLTDLLSKRINHHNDPSLRCLKEYTASSLQCFSFNGINSSNIDVMEFKENSRSLVQFQMSTTKYCMTTFKCCLKFLNFKPDSLSNTEHSKQANLFRTVTLIEKLFHLLKKCFTNKIWDVQPRGIIYETLQDFNECLILLGDVITNYQIQVSTNRLNKKIRAIYLCILRLSIILLENFIPLNKAARIIPKSLKSALTSSLFDISISKLYPDIHEKILAYIKMYKESNEFEFLGKFLIVNEICKSMTASTTFTRDFNAAPSPKQIALANESLISLQFHKDYLFVKILIETCATVSNFKMSEADIKMVENIILSLLSYNLDTVVECSYEACRKKIISAVGPTLNLTGIGVSSTQVLFLLRPKILVEIAEHGLNNTNQNVKRYAEDIIIHLVKSKILVTEEIWERIQECLVLSFPILLVYVSKMTAVGRTLMNVIDPDIANDLRILPIDVLRNNIILLFSPEDLVREEAFCRICWLLALQENSKSLAPRLNNINDRTLPNVFRPSAKVSNVNKSRKSDRFYETSSLHHVMELLNTKNVEPGIRRSALTQISVMLEDHLLHDIFLERGGVERILKVMNSALLEGDYADYADSVIPAVAILKNVCLYNDKVRLELSRDLNVYQCVLRGTFLFCTDERMKTDSSSLLFLLLYSSFIRGTPSRGNLAIPKVVNDRLNVPFTCQIYGETSEFTKEDYTQIIYSDKSCLRSIQIQWNSEVFGGFDQLLKMKHFDIPPLMNIPDELKIKAEDLDELRVSSIDISIKEILEKMEEIENFAITEIMIEDLMIYVYLGSLGKRRDRLVNFCWSDRFERFLTLLPSSEDDASLLRMVIKFLSVLVPFYKPSENNNWISSVLKEPANLITDIMSFENSSEEQLKALSKEFVNLITQCVTQEHHFSNFLLRTNEEISNASNNNSWAGVLEIVVDSLKLRDPQQLYNLAYLDCLLNCMVHLTASMGWSNNNTKKNSKKNVIKEIISGLCDLVDAFHYGKGPTASVSLMGLSITRNVLLILNHVLAEVKSSKVKHWDLLFVEEISEHNKVFNFFILYTSRDVVVRAAVLQLFAGLIESTRLARDIVCHFKKGGKCLWRMVLDIMFDDEEASIVRENAALILANLCVHRKITASDIPILHEEIAPYSSVTNNKNANLVHRVVNLLEQSNCVKKFKTIILSLYTLNIPESFQKEYKKLKSQNTEYVVHRTYKSGSGSSEVSWTSKGDLSLNVTTPTLVKTTAIFLNNLIELTEQKFVDFLNEKGVIKLVFRCVCNPSMELSDVKELSLYCEMLEMNAEICNFLEKAVRSSPGCLGTVLHTKDCMNTLISLLNPKAFNVIDIPQFLYLRNRLWSSIFDLITAFIHCGYQVQDPKKVFEISTILLEAICECGFVNFVATICEAIGFFKKNQLQNSVLVALTMILQVDSCYHQLDKENISNKSINMKYSMRELLDTVKAPFISDLEEEKECENSKKDNNNMSLYRLNLLEKIYFDGASKVNSKPKEICTEELNENFVYCGGEICKLLVHLYEINDMDKVGEESNVKQVILAAISSVLCVSTQAKYYALDTGFLQKIIETLKAISIKLSLESIDSFRRIGDKKRISPLLTDLDSISGMLTNFLLENVAVKCEASCLGLADIVHKLWNWFGLNKIHMINALKLLSTFTTNCPIACQSLPYTSPNVGTGPRKTPSTVSLLNEIVTKISREMEMLSKTHDIQPLRLCFNILMNCSSTLECRNCISKTNLLQSFLKLHPGVTKKQKAWETVEIIWMEFLQIFTVFPEGQMYVGKFPEVLELIIILTKNLKSLNKQAALTVLQNVAFYSPNRTRLLGMAEFMNTLIGKLENGTNKEKIIVVNIMWALAANNMKAKTILKSARLDVKLAEVYKKIQIINDNSLSEDEIERMQYVLNILRDSDKC